MDLYHLSSVPLTVGSTINPGNWGRIIDNAQWRHTLAVREMALEYARQKEFVDRPSRLKSAFAFLHREDAIDFRESNDAFQFHILYRVSLINVNADSGVTDWHLVAPSGPLRANGANAYWQNMTSAREAIAMGAGHHHELLTLSPLHIEERFD